MTKSGDNVGPVFTAFAPSSLLSGSPAPPPAPPAALRLGRASPIGTIGGDGYNYYYYDVNYYCCGYYYYYTGILICALAPNKGSILVSGIEDLLVESLEKSSYNISAA